MTYGKNQSNISEITMNSPRITSLAMIISAALLSACTSNGNYAYSHHQRDRNAAMEADTAARVRHMILADEHIALRHTVVVNVKNGEAELLGEARNAQERAQVHAIAQRTPGVRQVKNLMTLR